MEENVKALNHSLLKNFGRNRKGHIFSKKWVIISLHSFL